MMMSRFSTIIIAICVSVTLSTNDGARTNNYEKVQSRTWDQAITLAREFTNKLTLEEKCNMTYGILTPCAGAIMSIPRLTFDGLCFTDSPNGVGTWATHTTAFVGGIHIAATWDRNLAYQRAAAMGEEFRGKGVNFALGPMMNMDRNARGGRNWEGFGADPYLAGENAFAYVQGVQDQGVVATAKHYICNEQETNRNPGFFVTDDQLDPNPRVAYSANLDDKTMHEIYLWPFASSVAAGVGSMMCSFNQVNGTPACQNDKTQNGLLKGELEYKGNIMSDWGATKTGIESALGGLDIDMPGTDGLMGYALVAAVKNGSMSESRIDDMVIRIMSPYYLLSQDQGYPSVDLNRNVVAEHDAINGQLSRAGMILLKNIDKVLPLNITTIGLLHVYGAAAGQPTVGYKSSFLDQQSGALFQGGGSGFVIPSYAIDPLDALIAKGRENNFQVRYITNQFDYAAINNSFRGPSMHSARCLVFVSAYSSEGSDRSNLNVMNSGDKLVLTVAENCPYTIVIVNSVSQLNLEAWIDHPHVAAVLWSGMPGPEYGPALLDILFGNYNPGGKLVFTLARNDADFGTDISPSFDSNYTEGVFLNYRHFERYNITPRYYFGYGLSYTNFSFAQLDIDKVNNDDQCTVSLQYRQTRTRSYSNLGSSGLHDSVYEIKFTINNIGEVNGSEVPQLYLGFPPEAQQPRKVLRGFERVYLGVRQSQQVTLSLTQKDVSYWNVENQKWIVATGNYSVWISTSADNADVKLQGSFHM